MPVRKIDPANIDTATISEAAAVIRRGGLVAFPTETVYGLGADATNAEAVAEIFNAKGRPSYNPLIVHVADVTGALQCVTAWPDSAQTLAARFWPGPLTLVLPKQAIIPDIVTAGLRTVGIRVPSHPVALALLREAGVPIAAPSANRSTHVSPTLGGHVASSLGATPDLILDAGPASVGIESTVLDLSSAVPTILRPGMISADDIRAVIGRVEIAAATPETGASLPSPGMMDRHYSPAARLIVTDRPGAQAVIATAQREGSGARVVALTRTRIDSPAFSVWAMPESPDEYARALYATLHRADAAGFTAIVMERLPDDSAWEGLRDRIARAAR